MPFDRWRKLLDAADRQGRELQRLKEHAAELLHLPLVDRRKAHVPVAIERRKTRPSGKTVA